MKYFIVATILFYFFHVTNGQSSAYNTSRSDAEKAVKNLNSTLINLKDNITNQLRVEYNAWLSAQKEQALKVQNYQKYLNNCAAKKNRSINPILYTAINICVSPDAGNFNYGASSSAINTTIDLNIFILNETLNFCNKGQYEPTATICFKSVSAGTTTSYNLVSATTAIPYKTAVAAFNGLRFALNPCVTIANATLSLALRAINIDPAKC